MSRDADGEITKHIESADEKQQSESPKSLKNKNSVSYPFNFVGGLHGKYGRWDKILRDILNGKLEIVQNRRNTDTDTEEEDDDDEEEMPEATGKQTYDASERNGKYIPKQTNPEDDAIQIHTDGEISGENT